MSTSYYPYCVDCDERHWFDDHRGPAQLKALVKNAEAIKAIVPVLTEIAEHGYNDVEITLSHGRDKLQLDWFVKHAGHNLQVQDEYGRLVGECAEFFYCQHCNHQMTCRMPDGHDGDHSDKRPASEMTRKGEK